jgi:hypothetical protein
MFGLLVASSCVGALYKSAPDEHYVEESFSTDPKENEIIPLNEQNLLPEYSETEDTATYKRSCSKRTKTSPVYKVVHKCSDDCWCRKCVRD